MSMIQETCDTRALDPERQRTCRLVTLGCKANQYDTQLVRESLLGSGYRELTGNGRADLCVVNTCTVTRQADAEGRQLIRRLVRENPGTRVVVMGCYAARDAATVRSIAGVAAVVEHLDDLPTTLRQFGVAQLVAGISRFEGHHRAFVKVQDGCLLDCTFCIIPQVRPSLRSRPPEQVEAEVARLVAAGCQEVVLTGIHLGHYGVDLSTSRPRTDWCRLWHLIGRLARIPGQWRLRLSSLEAAEMTDEFVEVLASEPRVCPHLHLSLQSGSDAVLARMRRRYRVAGFLRRLEQVRRTLDEPAFTTDVIVGFPGETEADFAETLRVCEAAGFSKIHIFPFSPRRGTPAADMPQPVAPAVIRDRRRRLGDLEAVLARRYRARLLGRTLDVLVEREEHDDSRRVRGTACRYVPVTLPGQADWLGRLVRARVDSVGDDALHARPDVPSASPEYVPLPVLASERSERSAGSDVCGTCSFNKE